MIRHMSLWIKLFWVNDHLPKIVGIGTGVRLEDDKRPLRHIHHTDACFKRSVGHTECG